MHRIARALALSVTLSFACAGLGACQQAGGGGKALDPPSAQAVRTASGLAYDEPAVGAGDEAVAGKMVSVHYTGWLQADGTQFDTSRSRGQPFEFKLGAGSVIKGWDEGVAGMKVGGKRRLFIPPALGYGDRGAGGVIPPGAALVFDVELIEVN